ncbi:MAG: hypothetical protein KBD63_05930 [Bacteriovoracaceae bacterium]|nr:hypothetical protein [Bacteriovoracaceae bacterium]
MQLKICSGFLLGVAGLSLLSCSVDLTKKSSGRSSILSNSPSDVSADSSLVLQYNPVVVRGGAVDYNTLSLGEFLDPTAVFITSNSTLTEACTIRSGNTDYTINPCYNTFDNPFDQTTFGKNAGTWAYPPDSSQFLQVHTFYHTRKSVENFLRIIAQVKTRSSLYSYSSIPTTLISDKGFWKSDNLNNIYSPLNVYAECGDFSNAYFSPARFELCFGKDPNRTNLVYSQDPSVIHHEAGHAFVYIMMNMRNVADTNVLERSNLGTLGYDEAGAINEGIADYFSYVIDDRTHFAEWALGTDYSLNRPMSEDEAVHAGGISTTDQGRLAYPDYLHYEYGNLQTPIEDIHNAGQITSHYLVALTRKLQTTCGITLKASQDHVLHILAETLSELGDLTATGFDSNSSGYYVNLHPDAAYTSAHIMNPPNYQKFYQVFAKNIGRYLSTSLCLAFTKDASEHLLDTYGLLLFKTYNDDGDDSVFGHSASPSPSTVTDFTTYLTGVSPSNRLRSVLISKDNIFYPSIGTQAYVVDGQSDMNSVLQALQTQYGTVISSLTPSDLRFNNGNGQLSPGEVAGIHLNLKNISNSPMAGLQILANDWDHVKEDPADSKRKPCNTFEDEWPLSSAGAAPEDLTPNVAGNCDYITRTNGTATNDPDALHPVCFVEVPDTQNSSTKWVSQKELAPGFAGPGALYHVPNCLDNNKPEECLIRFLPPQFSVYSKLDAQKTLLETLQGSNSTTPSLNASSLLIMEINKWAFPGMRINCRLRAKFSNCLDCNHSAVDDDNPLAFEYSGADYFKVINFTFTVGP